MFSLGAQPSTGGSGPRAPMTEERRQATTDQRDCTPQYTCDLVDFEGDGTMEVLLGSPDYPDVTGDGLVTVVGLDW